jgi:hypothetical protein
MCLDGETMPSEVRLPSTLRVQLHHHLPGPDNLAVPFLLAESLASIPSVWHGHVLSRRRCSATH